MNRTIIWLAWAAFLLTAVGLPAQSKRGKDADTGDCLDKIVVIKRNDIPLATGFIVKLGEQLAVVTAMGEWEIDAATKLVDINGRDIPYAGLLMPKSGGDLIFFELADTEAGRGHVEIEESITDNVKMNERTYVYGLRPGTGATTRVKGTVMGIGPARLELKAKAGILPGGPVVSQETGRAIGVAHNTAATSRKERHATPPGALRLDNLSAMEKVSIEQLAEIANAVRQLQALVANHRKGCERLTQLLDAYDLAIATANSTESGASRSSTGSQVDDTVKVAINDISLPKINRLENRRQTQRNSLAKDLRRCQEQVEVRHSLMVAKVEAAMAEAREVLAELSELKGRIEEMRKSYMDYTRNRRVGDSIMK